MIVSVIRQIRQSCSHDLDHLALVPALLVNTGVNSISGQHIAIDSEQSMSRRKHGDIARFKRSQLATAAVFNHRSAVIEYFLDMFNDMSGIPCFVINASICFAVKFNDIEWR